jgi:dipeptidyl-peptidase 4
VPGLSDAAVSLRYARAAAAVPPRVLSRQPSAAVDGYWLDERRFFFVTGEPEADGLLADAPKLADAVSGVVVDVLPRVVLRGLAEVEILSTQDWLGAVYDMPTTDRLAVQVGGSHHLIDIASRTVVESRPAGPAAIYAPDGRSAVELDGWNLRLRDLASGSARPLTHAGEPHWSYGRQPENDTAPVVYRRSPYPMALWSSDSAWILTHRIDERDTPETAIVEHAPPGGGAPVLHRFKLSAVGDPLPKLQLVAIRPLDGRMVVTAPMALQAFPPLAYRAAWFCGPETVAHVRQDRFRRTAELVLWDLTDGSERVLIGETVETGYLSFHPEFGTQPNVRVLANGEAVWWSERDGWGHLYLYGPDGELVRQLTSGAWQVRDLVHLDEAGRRLLFTAGGLDPKTDPALRSLCAVSLDGGPVEVLLAHAGDIAVRAEPNGGFGQDRPFRPSNAKVGASPDGRFVVACRTSLTGGSETVTWDIAGRIARTLSRAPSPTTPARPFQATAADGETPLFGALITPSDFDPAKTYPLLDLIYPGPQQALLPRGAGSRTEAQARAFAELGMVVLLTDTRHMPFRARALHQAGYGGQWEPQVADHVAVIDQLCREHAFLDRSRVGLLGISGGGAATAWAMFNYPEVFRPACRSAATTTRGSTAPSGWTSTWGRSIPRTATGTPTPPTPAGCSAR